MANSVIPLYYLNILLRKVLKAFLVLLTAVSEAPFNVKIWGRLDFMVFQSFAFDFKVWAFIILYSLMASPMWIWNFSSFLLLFLEPFLSSKKKYCMLAILLKNTLTFFWIHKLILIFVYICKYYSYLSCKCENKWLFSTTRLVNLAFLFIFLSASHVLLQVF